MVMKVETTISGLEGGHAVMNLYFDVALGFENDAAAALATDRVHDALSHVIGGIHPSVIYTISPTVVAYNAATGAVTAALTGNGHTEVTSGSGTLLPSATALVAIWDTGVAGPRRLIRGRTFLSGFTTNFAGAGGVPAAGILTSGQAFCDAMVDAGTTDVRFGVWHRPKAGTGGAFHPVTAQHISPKWGVLKSRRD